MNTRKNRITAVAVIGGIIVMAVLIFGTIWMGQNAKKDTDEAVRKVSMLYLDELAGRREQVVSSNLKEKIGDIRTALDIMTEEDLSDKAHLEAYQSKMKQLFNLERFAFVDSSGGRCDPCRGSSSHRECLSG